jgi:hypothetical protein
LLTDQDLPEWDDWNPELIEIVQAHVNKYELFPLQPGGLHHQRRGQ